MIAATSPISSTGLTNDVAALLDAVTVSASSRMFLLFPPECVKKMAMARAASALLFPDLTVAGGEIAGVPVIPTDGLTDAAICVDAAQLAANRGAVSLSVSEQGDVELQSSPTMDSETETGVALVSMWQSGLVGLKAQRTLAYEIFRRDAVASISGIAY